MPLKDKLPQQDSSELGALVAAATIPLGMFWYMKRELKREDDTSEFSAANLYSAAATVEIMKVFAYTTLLAYILTNLQK